MLLLRWQGCRFGEQRREEKAGSDYSDPKSEQLSYIDLFIMFPNLKFTRTIKLSKYAC